MEHRTITSPILVIYSNGLKIALMALSLLTTAKLVTACAQKPMPKCPAQSLKSGNCKSVAALDAKDKVALTSKFKAIITECPKPKRPSEQGCPAPIFQQLHTKTLFSWSTCGLDAAVYDFQMNNPTIKVRDIKFSATDRWYNAMIIFEY